MFDRLTALVAGLTGAKAIEAPEAPPSEMRVRARHLLSHVTQAIASGAWAVDGANDPDGAVARLEMAIGLPGTDLEIAELTMDLVDCSVAAIGENQWGPTGDEFEAVIEANVVAMALRPANDDPKAPAVAV